MFVSCWLKKSILVLFARCYSQPPAWKDTGRRTQYHDGRNDRDGVPGDVRARVHTAISLTRGQKIAQHHRQPAHRKKKKLKASISSLTRASVRPKQVATLTKCAHGAASAQAARAPRKTDRQQPSLARQLIPLRLLLYFCGEGKVGKRADCLAQQKARKHVHGVITQRRERCGRGTVPSGARTLSKEDWQSRHGQSRPREGRFACQATIATTTGGGRSMHVRSPPRRLAREIGSRRGRSRTSDARDESVTKFQ